VTPVYVLTIGPMATVATCGTAKVDLLEARPEDLEHPFSPHDILLKQFSVHKIKQVLSSYHTCSTCKEDHRLLQNMKGRIDQEFGGYAGRIMPTPLNKDNLAASSSFPIAILVHIGRPLLFIPFVDRKRNDSSALDSYVNGSFSHPRPHHQFWLHQRESSAQVERKLRLLAKEMRANISQICASNSRRRTFYCARTEYKAAIL